MKRSAALVGLSREHHTALSLAQRARLAASGDAEAVTGMAAQVRASFANELQPHFAEEEAWLLPALAAAGEKVLVERTLAEHAELVARAALLTKPSPDNLLAFADCLTRHVRFEERELFVVAESHPECLIRCETPS